MLQRDFGSSMRWPALLCLLAMTVAGCGPGDENAGESAGNTQAPDAAAGAQAAGDENSMTKAIPDDVGGTAWKLVSIRDDEPVSESIVATITFEGDGFAGQGPCNRYFGSRNTDPESPGLFGPIGATRMMCPDAQMQYEDMYLAALGYTRNIHRDGDRLIFEWMSFDGGEWGDMVFIPDQQAAAQE